MVIKNSLRNWTPIYNITYELYGGTNDEENPETYNESNKDIELKPAVKEGFEFLGWFDNDKFEGEAVTKIAANATGHLTLHANFKEIVTYEITYELDGGTNNAKNPAGFNFLDLPITLEDPFKRRILLLKAGMTMPILKVKRLLN